MSDKQHDSGQTPTDAAKLRKRAEEQARTPCDDFLVGPSIPLPTPLAGVKID